MPKNYCYSAAAVILKYKKYFTLYNLLIWCHQRNPIEFYGGIYGL